MERLQKVIAERGYCSRRKAEELIREGRVTVDGKTVDQLGGKVDENALIMIDGKPVERDEKVVYLLNKPKNVISSTKDEKGRKTVTDLIDSPYRLYPLGRLDFDSSGLILLSNDGELMQKLLHPRNEVEKTYEVTLSSLIEDEEIKKLEKGVLIEGRKTARARIKLIRTNPNKNTSFLEITIHEGRNRQVRKMFASMGHEVIKLHRTKEAGITLGNLKSGEYRRLKPHEVKKLKSYLDTGDL